MNAAKSAVRTIKEMEELIRAMKHEIDCLRVIVYRYNKLHGKSVYPLPIEELSDEIDFLLMMDKPNQPTCNIIKTEELGLVSKYKKIVEVIESLEQ